MHTKINLRIQFDNMMIFRIAESIKRLQETIYPKWSSTRTNTPPRPHTAPAATFSTNSERPRKPPQRDLPHKLKKAAGTTSRDTETHNKNCRVFLFAKVEIHSGRRGATKGCTSRKGCFLSRPIHPFSFFIHPSR